MSASNYALIIATGKAKGKGGSRPRGSEAPDYTYDYWCYVNETGITRRSMMLIQTTKKAPLTIFWFLPNSEKRPWSTFPSRSTYGGRDIQLDWVIRAAPDQIDLCHHPSLLELGALSLIGSEILKNVLHRRLEFGTPGGCKWFLIILINF